MNLKTKILMIVITPALLIGIMALIISNLTVTGFMKEEIKQELKLAANSGLEFYEDSNTEAFTRGEDGIIKKGDSFIVTDNYDFVDKIKEKGEIDTTFFYGDERIVTSLLDENGKRLIGTKASEEVVEKVLNQGEEYFTENVKVNGVAYYGYYLPIKQAGSDEVIGMFFAGDKVENVQQAIRFINILIGTGILVILILSVLIAVLLVLSITKALKRTVDQLDQLAAGRLNICENQKDLKRKDEIGDIVKSSVKLQKSLVAMIKSISGTSNILNEASGELEQAAGHTMSATEGIEKSVEDMASGAISQAESTEDAARQIQIMGENIDNTAKAVEILNSNAEMMKKSSEQAMVTLDELNLVNAKTKNAIDVIYKQTNETNEFAQKIKEAANLITAVAEETNLLALNASIEAARAGELGKGFGVVAEQIKKLASESSDSAKRIDEIIHNLIENSDKAVEKMEDARNVISLQNDNLDKTKEVFHLVYDGIHESIHKVDNIAEISGRLNEVKDSVTDIVNTLSAVSQENAASTEETSASAAELTATMNQVKQEVSVLRSLAAELEKNIKMFQL